LGEIVGIDFDLEYIV